jgi:hypothetical protein
MYDSRTSLPNEVRADIEQFLGNARGTNCAWAKARVLPTFIRRNIKLAEAPSYGQTIFEYDPNCHGAEDYRKVAEFLHNQSLANTEATESTRCLEQGQREKCPIEIVEVTQTDDKNAPRNIAIETMEPCDESDLKGTRQESG